MPNRRSRSRSRSRSNQSHSVENDRPIGQAGLDVELSSDSQPASNDSTDMRSARTSAWRSFAILAATLLMVGGVLIGGTWWYLDHQRTERAKRDAAAGPETGRRLDEAAKVAQRLAVDGRFVREATLTEFRTLAERIEAADPRIGFVKIAPRGAIVGGGVYIVVQESSPTELRLSSLIDTSGDESDLVFSVTVQPIKTEQKPTTEQNDR